MRCKPAGGRTIPLTGMEKTAMDIQEMAERVSVGKDEVIELTLVTLLEEL